MEIFELEKNRDKKIAEKKSLVNKIYGLKLKLELHANDFNEDKVLSHVKNKELSVLGQIEEMEKDLEIIDNELNGIDEDINSLYQIFKKYRDEEQQIYTEKKLYKWSNAKISAKHGGISKRYINKIVKKITDNFNQNN